MLCLQIGIHPQPPHILRHPFPLASTLPHNTLVRLVCTECVEHTHAPYVLISASCVYISVLFVFTNISNVHVHIMFI